MMCACCGRKIILVCESDFDAEHLAVALLACPACQPAYRPDDF